jgi:hypothetical protein
MRPRVHRKLTLEELEPRIAPGVAVAYVDDDFNSGTPGWGVDHFALIQDGVAAVDAGGAVDVAGGVYNETVTLDRNATVNLQGAETLGGVTMSTGTIVCAGSNLTIISDYSQSGGAFVSAPTQGSFSVGGNFSLSGGTFNRFTGSGGAGDPYLIHDVYGLQAMKFGLGASYQLADDVDAAATSAWNGGLGFDPVGDLDHRFTGSLHGDGRTIAGLHIVRPSENFVGLIGFATDGSSVTNVGLVGGTVQGYAGVGGLVGWNSGDISHCYTTMDVSGNWIVGGLVGDHCYGERGRRDQWGRPGRLQLLRDHLRLLRHRRRGGRDQHRGTRGRE